MPRKILVVDDLATNRIVMKVLLERAHYEVVQAGSGQAALDRIAEARPDLVLLDMLLPDMNGIALCQALKSARETADLPVILNTASQDPGAKMRALEAGADEFLTKPLNEVTLLARVRNLLRTHATTQELGLHQDTQRALGFAEPTASFAGPAQIALISPPRVARCWRTALAALTDDRLTLMTRAEALSPVSDTATPDLFVIGYDPGDEAIALRLVIELRTRPETRHAAILFAAPETARDTGAMALDLGANDLVATPADPRELALRIRNQLSRQRHAKRLRASLEDGLRLAVTDALTGLHNRRYALPHLARMASRASRTGQDFAVIAVDIDRFKQVNDRHGHAAGDAVIATIAHRLKTAMRDTDLVARIGGEEFLIALPDTDRAGATRIAEQLRQMVGATPIALPGTAGNIGVTISLGVAIGKGADIAAPKATEQQVVDVLMAQADRALYAAKAAGRNAVEISRSAAA